MGWRSFLWRKGLGLQPEPPEAVEAGEDLLPAGPGQKGDAGGGAAQSGQTLLFQQALQGVHHLAQGAPAVQQGALGVEQTVARAADCSPSTSCST